MAKGARSLKGAESGVASERRGSSAKVNRMGREAAMSLAAEVEEEGSGRGGAGSSGPAGFASQQQWTAAGSQQVVPESSTTTLQTAAAGEAMAIDSVPTGRTSERSRRMAVSVFTVGFEYKILRLMSELGKIFLMMRRCGGRFSSWDFSKGGVSQGLEGPATLGYSTAIRGRLPMG